MKGKKYELITLGGSLGGIEALSMLLQSLPEHFPLPIVVVLHRLRNVKSSLVDLLATKAKITVKEADEKEPIKPGVMYIAPANYHLLIEKDKTLSLCISGLVNYSRPSIDVTFQSAADVYKDKLIGILLTGANEDGAEGLQYMAEQGGLTIVQEPSEAQSPVMPLGALKRFKPEYILDIEGIKKFLLELDSYAR